MLRDTHTLPAYAYSIRAQPDSEEDAVAHPEARRTSGDTDLRWLVRLRWVAVVAVTICAAVAQEMGMIDSGATMAGVTLALGAGNLVWQILLRPH